jgi:hypothetical protein
VVMKQWTVEGRTQRREEEDHGVWCCYKNVPAFKSVMSKLPMVSVLCQIFCVQLLIGLVSFVTIRLENQFCRTW